VCAVWRAHHAAHTPQHDGLHILKHVGVTVKKCCNVNFNILYVKYEVHLLVKES
jgi:hypothetical protein